MLGLTELLDRKPRQLSGGQRQRVAMGRAIVRNPQVFLMDEPLSNLDAKLRAQMRGEMLRLQRELEVTAIYVTHDQVEAMTMGDRVVVMREGRASSRSTRRAGSLRARPRTCSSRRSRGGPPMNLLKGNLVLADGDDLVVLVGSQRPAVPARVASEHAELIEYVGRDVGIGVRPEHVTDAATVTDGTEVWRLAGKVVATELLGSDLLVYLEIDAEPVLTAEVIEVAADIDASSVDELRADAEESRTPVVCRFEAGSRTRVDDPIEISFSTGRVHFFDLSSGLAIRPH